MVLGRFGSIVVLRRRRDFVRVQSRGRRSKGRYVVVLSLPSSVPTRVGFTVSKRVGNAVVRNRTRRRIKEILRLSPSMLPVGADVVVIAYPGAARVSSGALAGDLERCFQRLRRESSDRLQSDVPR
ncbi:MAG: ribonuclease P protein component [Myxococcota bacterium]